MTFGLIDSCAFKALEDASLHLHSASLVVQERLSHWAQVVSYISETGQRQGFQNLYGRVSLFVLLLPIWFVWFVLCIDDVRGPGFRCGSDRGRVF